MKETIKIVNNSNKLCSKLGAKKDTISVQEQNETYEISCSGGNKKHFLWDAHV